MIAKQKGITEFVPVIAPVVMPMIMAVVLAGVLTGCAPREDGSGPEVSVRGQWDMKAEKVKRP